MKDITDSMTLDEKNKSSLNEALQHYNGAFRQNYETYAEVCRFSKFPSFEEYLIQVYIPMMHNEVLYNE
jgi:hypothetical protein